MRGTVCVCVCVCVCVFLVLCFVMCRWRGWHEGGDGWDGCHDREGGCWSVSTTGGSWGWTMESSCVCVCVFERQAALIGGSSWDTLRFLRHCIVMLVKIGGWVVVGARKGQADEAGLLLGCCL